MDHPGPGNSYDLYITDRGHHTFRHRASGELLHHVGPFLEARTLYAALLLGPHMQSQERRQDPVVVWDVGMGCGFNVLEVFAGWARGEGPACVHVVSFDLESQGLVTLLSHKATFAQDVHPRAWALVDDLVTHGRARDQSSSQERLFSWEFCGGDFRKTVEISSIQAPQFIFYDFFSAKVHPHLWELKVFQKLRDRCLPTTVLATYATATAVRASLAAGGFFIGFGPTCGQRSPTTQASPTLGALSQPMPPQWKQTFLRSGKPFLNPEDLGECQRIVEAIGSHPQFL